MDGTKVWLNSNSKLVFPTRFGKNIRQISLTGEAFFEVAPNPLIPFTIDVNGTEVCVVGTTFNINAYGDSHEMVTTVVEGQVLVSDAFWKKEVPLMANEQLSVNNLTGVAQKKTIDADLYTAWIRGRLVFENENLENLMIRLERLYDVKITISDNVDKSLKFTGNIKRYDDLNTVLDMLATTQNVHFSMDAHGVTVFK
jgi:ferric-dicitrate binding protein FerR (iron transport regulator)